MRRHNPPHPGEVLKELCLEPIGLSVTEAADALGVSRKALSSILNGRAGISPEMAIRLSMAFGTSAESLAQPAVDVRPLASRAAPSKATRPALDLEHGPAQQRHRADGLKAAAHAWR